MCGIFFYYTKDGIRVCDKDCIQSAFNQIKHRGPDRSRLRYEYAAVTGFHRLGIMDPDDLKSMQPFVSDDQRYICVVNGEIYNWRELREQLLRRDSSATFVSESDCEVVLRIFESMSRQSKCQVDTQFLETLCKSFDGEYAFIIHDTQSNETYYGTDELGVRPLFMCHQQSTRHYAFCSEQKGLVGLREIGLKGDISRVEPGTTGIINANGVRVEKRYFSFNPDDWKIDYRISFEQATEVLYELLRENVRSKLPCDRDRVALLSGGLDSSLVCGMIAKEIYPQRLRTFTVGFSSGAPDILAARKVAKHINSIHTEIIITFEEGLEAIPFIIQMNESYDQTTTRASVPMYLAVKKIKEMHPEVGVIYSGEVADELLRGYLYSLLSPSVMEGRQDIFNRLRDICYYDGLRADRVVSSVGCELRLPFFSRKLLEFVFTLPPEFLDPKTQNNIEKRLLRKAFEGKNIIPDEILFRTKNALSDATSELKENGSEWKERIKERAKQHITPNRFEYRKVLYPSINEFSTPRTFEDMWYREEFEQYSYNVRTVPGYWKPSWTDPELTDSSATALAVFHTN